MNVTELARQLKTTREELLNKLPELGFDIGARAIKVDNSLAERIKKAWGDEKRSQKLVDKMAKRQVVDKTSESENDKKAKEINFSDKITVSELAEKLDLDVTRLIGYLMKNGIMASLSQQIDFETASIVAEDHGFKAVRSGEQDALDNKDEWRDYKEKLANEKDAKTRPPVVVIMGHVDHGKTTLLDTIRKTNIVEGESGGITQHIGAYQTKEKGKIITFLDTPGHEAFKSMRERGGQVADMAILVVAADDGLKPQTLESIKVIQQENLPFIIAINKVDKPEADIDNVKKELAEINLQPEDWGGKVITVPVSAKKGDGIHELLDMVLLVADLEKFSASLESEASGVIIESHISPGEGPVATVLVNAGILKIGDEVVIGDTYGKIKSLKDWKGAPVDEAVPSMPVKILGLKDAPRVGDILRATEVSREQKKQKGNKKYRFVEEQSNSATQTTETESEDESKDDNDLHIIVKADVLGSLEALISSVKKLGNQKVGIDIIKQGLGSITESDIALAEGSRAVLYGFNVQISSEARQVSYQTKASVKTFTVIYELLDDIKERMSKLVKKEIIEVPQGDLEILKIFKDSRAESIVGGRVKRSKITKDAKFRLIRDGKPLDEGSVLELQQNKQSVDELAEGVEAGLKLTGARGFKEGDILSFYTEEEKAE